MQTNEDSAQDEKAILQISIKELRARHYRYDHQGGLHNGPPSVFARVGTANGLRTYASGAIAPSY